MEKSKIIRLIVSIFLSIALWIYVINVVNPTSSTVIRNVPVQLENEQSLSAKGLAIMGSGEYTVDLTVSAPRKDLGVISADNFVATADVSELTMGQDYITVSVIGPKGYTISEIRSRKIQVYVDELATVTVPVVVNMADAANGYEACVLSVYPETVEISGARQLVENVERYNVTLDTQNELNFEEEISLTKTGVPQNGLGANIEGLRVENGDIDIKATIYSQKTVRLNVIYSGDVWTGANISAVNYPETLVIKGSTQTLSKISELNSRTISIDGISEDYSTDININLPGGVYLSKQNPNPKFTVDIADNGSIQFEYSLSGIKTENLSDSFAASYKSSGDKVIATITGPVKTLKTLAKSDITLSVDGSSFTATGTKDVKLNSSSQVSSISISLSVSQVNVTIRKR